VSDIKIFSKLEFGKIRMVNLEGKPYAVGNDIAKALEYKSPKDAVSTHCKGAISYRLPTNGGKQEMKVIPEGDIYRLIVKAADQSKNPNIKVKAERFERWIFDEVLPQINHTGGYIPTGEEDSEDDIMAKAFLIAKRKIELKDKTIAEKEKQLKEQEPQVIFANAVKASNTSILVGDLAKFLKQNGINIGANRLFIWLRNNGYLIKKKGSSYNMPTQYSMELQLFEIKETSITHSDGHISINKTPKVTGKGQIYFVNKFKELFNKKIDKMQNM
jgi:anti-repressor protein